MWQQDECRTRFQEVLEYRRDANSNMMLVMLQPGQSAKTFLSGLRNGEPTAQDLEGVVTLQPNDIVRLGNKSHGRLTSHLEHRV